jgi:dihydrofolate reductase
MVFNSVSLDGYFTGEGGDISWVHAGADDDEWRDFVSGNAQGGGVLLFGRKTYEMMASFWPTPEAARQMPAVAKAMNQMPKVVFSRSMVEAKWSNTTLVKDDLVGAVRKLKTEPGPGMVIMGSGTIVAQLTAAGLIDEFQLVEVPIVLGRGRTMFEGLKQPVNLRRTNSRTFKNGRVLLCYEPG